MKYRKIDPLTGKKAPVNPLNKEKLSQFELDEYMMEEEDEI